MPDMEAHAVIRQMKLRKTSSRLTILSFITSTHTPVSVEEIEMYLKRNHISFDNVTVYRTVNTFVKKGILKRVDFHEGKFRYEMANLPHHHHIICTVCGKVEDVEDCLKKCAEQTIEKQTGYTISSHSLEFFGTCKKCKKK